MATDVATEMDNLWVDLVNTQRSNFVRANIVGEDGLARQAALAVAVEMSKSDTLQEQWEAARPWHELASPEYVQAVETGLHNLDRALYRSGTTGLHP